MDTVHTQGVHIIQNLQYLFQDESELMLVLSHLGDPRNAFLVYFPLAYFWDKALGVKVMWVSVAAEWINAILKWLLHGERPYWWVHETSLYDKPPTLQQYRLTCETGPGSPSGHAMVTASVLYLLASHLPSNTDTPPINKGNSHSNNEKLHSNKKNNIPLVRSLGHLFVTCVMVAVCVSRCYISSHFPHQVLVGTLAGYLLAQTFDRLSLNSVSKGVYISASVVVLVSGPAVFYSIQAVGLDPSWSVSLAMRWCAKAEWVYLDTTLFFALVRDAASLLGIGLSVHLFPAITDIQSQWTPSKHSVCTRTLCLLLSILVTRGQEYIRVPHHNSIVFYSLSFLKYCALPIIVTVVLPFLVTKTLQLFFSNDFKVEKLKNKGEKSHSR